MKEYVMPKCSKCEKKAKVDVGKDYLFRIYCPKCNDLDFEKGFSTYAEAYQDYMKDTKGEKQ